MVATRAVAARSMIVAAGVVAACSGKPRADEPSTRPAVGGSAAGTEVAAGLAIAPDGSPAVPAAGDAGRGTGDLQIRVEWPDVPVAARSSPGRTPCNTPRAPAVAPTTTWGIPDVLVIVDGVAPPGGGSGAGAAVGAAGQAHVTLADCALDPRVAVGAALAITSALDRPAKLVLRRRGAFAAIASGSPLATGDAIPVMLPIAGHTAIAALDAGAIYSLETDAADPEIATIAALPDGFVTDGNGQVLVHDVAAGAHGVTAWLPPRAGQPARIARATANVATGDLSELTITLMAAPRP